MWRNILLPRLQHRGCRLPTLHSPGVWNTYRRQGEFLPQNKGGMCKQEWRGAPLKKRGLLLFSRWIRSIVSIAVRRMVWRKQFSCWFLSHPKITIQSPPKLCSIYNKNIGEFVSHSSEVDRSPKNRTLISVLLVWFCVPWALYNQIHSICRLWWDSPKHCSSHNKKAVSFTAQTALSEFRSWKLGGFCCVLSHQLSFFFSLWIIMDVIRNRHFNLDFYKSVWTILLTKRSKTY